MERGKAIINVARSTQIGVAATYLTGKYIYRFYNKNPAAIEKHCALNIMCGQDSGKKP
jgi:hypothetical protein